MFRLYWVFYRSFLLDISDIEPLEAMCILVCINVENGIGLNKLYLHCDIYILFIWNVHMILMETIIPKQ